MFPLLLLQINAQQLDVSNQQSVRAATQQMANNLMAYYVPGKTASQGAINQNGASDATGFQWYEGGIMWGALMEYIKTTGDATHATTISQALTLASFGKTASFLGM